MASLDSVISRIQNLDAAIEDALDKEVAEAIKETLVAVAREKVYDAYTPKFLSRRDGNGGVLDKNSMTHEAHGTELTVWDRPKWQQLYGGTIPAEELVEALAKGDARFHFAEAGERPFHEAAKQRVISDGTAEEALRRGLQRQGIDTSNLQIFFT